jgi:glutamate racemase
VFVALAEEGWIKSPATLAAVEHYLGPLFRSPSAPDTLVLGCTHFPVLAEAIRNIVGGDVAMVDSAETTASAVTEALAGAELQSAAGPPGSPAVRFLATDSPDRFARVGAVFFGSPIDPDAVMLVDLHTR